MDKVTEQVISMYERYPYPSTGFFREKINLETHADKITRSLGLKAKQLSREAEVLDAGCGTGEIACSLAASVKSVTAFDLTENSLKRAKLLALKNNLRNIEFRKENLLELNLNKEFDFVFCIGVLHHTSDPYKCFQNLVKHTKKGGRITLGLYSSYGRLFHRAKKAFIGSLSSNIDERISLSRKFFYRNLRNPSEESKIYLADKFAHPNERYNSLEQVMHWFELNEIKPIGIAPNFNGNFSRLNLLKNQLKWMKNRTSFFFISGYRK